MSCKDHEHNDIESITIAAHSDRLRRRKRRLLVLLISVPSLLLLRNPTAVNGQCSLANDSCAYQNDGSCDAGTFWCQDELSDCVDCDPLRDFDSTCNLCISNGGNFCSLLGGEGGGGDDDEGVCLEPLTATGFPDICWKRGGTAFVTDCNDLSQSFSCSSPTTTIVNLFNSFQNDPCISTLDGNCDAGGPCDSDTDCFDCDPFQDYNHLGCQACIDAGGAYCSIPDAGNICSAPNLAEAFPFYCVNQGGSQYYISNCPEETPVCDFENDPCPRKMDGKCQAGRRRRCPASTSDCFDCSPCLDLRFEGCESCTAAGCLWCGSDSLCIPLEVMPNMLPLTLDGADLTCTTPNDYVDTCPSTSQQQFEGAHLDAMDWVYELVNIKPVWEAGITGSGVGVRINDDGVDNNQPNFLRNFDVDASCSNYTPAVLGDEFYSHGTTCAALLASAPENECMVGIAPNVTISSCRIFNEDGWDWEATAGFRYLYEHQEQVDISSNSYGLEACYLLEDRRRRRRRRMQGEEGNTCPFVQQDAFTPCSAESACMASDWISSSALVGPSADCEREIIDYCVDPLNQENDVAACLSFLDLFVQCEYNAQDEQERDALIRGVTEGRGGKGMIYVFSVSNYNELGADVNTEGLLNSRFTVSVGSIGRDGIHTSFSATGAALFVTAPVGDLDHYTNIITSLAGGDRCYDAGYGTSFATPLVAGVAALMLQVNPELTWRDVQGILATTSQKLDANDESWTTNDAGIHHSYRYGFGVVDAFAAVTAAETWTNYGKELQILAESGEINLGIPEYPNDGVESVVTVEREGMVAESVVVYLDLSHSSRGDLDVILISPSGTESILHPSQRPENTQVDERWKLMTVRNWQEDAAGEWTLRVEDQSAGDTADCAGFPGWSFVADFTTYAEDYFCIDLRIEQLCTPDGGEGIYLRDYGFQYDESLGLNDPFFLDEDGVGPLQACCECGGGYNVSSTPDVLKSWRLIIYGHERPEGDDDETDPPPPSPPTPSSSSTLTNSNPRPTSAPTQTPSFATSRNKVPVMGALLGTVLMLSSLIR